MPEKYLLASDLETIETRFNVRLDRVFEPIPKKYGISSGDNSYVITSEDPNILQPLRFGLTPFYATDPVIITAARAEGDKNSRNDPEYNGSRALFLKPEFRKPILSQRCLVMADAWYGKSGTNKPWLFYLQKKNRPLAMAGIYDHWQNPKTGEIISGFCVITTVASDLLRSVGVMRMPVILSRSAEKRWIKSSAPLSDLLSLLLPYPSDNLNGYPLSELADIPGFNDPTMLDPLGERLRAEAHPLKNLHRHRAHREKGNSGIAWFDPT